MKIQINLANGLTFARFLLIIPFLYFLFLKPPNILELTEFLSKLIALIIFLLASITDYFDGYFARLLNETSRFGKFLDPLADKFLVASALIAFLQLEGGLIPYWMVLLIIFREFLITALRITALSQQQEVETMKMGKAKTTFQILTIIVILFFLVLKAYYYPQEYYPKSISLDSFLGSYFQDWGNFIRYSPLVLMTITTLITVGSGIRYLWKNRALFLAEL